MLNGYFVINSYVIEVFFSAILITYNWMFCYIDVTLNIRYILWDVYRMLAECNTREI
jgi:hypothetical protein